MYKVALAGIFIFAVFFPSLFGTVLAQIQRPDEMKVIGKKVQDANLFDHEGRYFNVYSIFDGSRVVIVSPIFTKCPHTCPLITSSLRKVVEKIYSRGLTNFKVLTISFDDTDTPEDLKKYIEKFNLGEFVERGVWILASGKSDQIKTFLNSFDFRYIKHENGLFDHPNLIAFLSPDGKLSKFIYGFSYQEEDVMNAILEVREPMIGLRKFSKFILFIGVIGFIATSIFLIYRNFGRSR